MISTKLFLSGFFLGITGILAGCSTKHLSTSKPVYLPDQIQEVSGDHGQTLGKNSSLLVGLKPYLGREKIGLKSAQELRLKSAGKLLILEDATGLLHKSLEINLAWRKVPLLTPKKLERQVIGPFASFESAERLALKLRKKGFSAVIAHPQAWEIWVPKEVQLPQGISALSWEKTLKHEVKPVLKGVSGELLLTGPLRIEAPDGLQLKNGVFMGPFWLKADAYGSWTLVEEVPLERYLLGVVPHEIGSSAPSAALAAQAILARTWALANSHRFDLDGYHLCSDTQCQVYKDPRQASQSVKGAITNTAGQYLSWQNKPIHAVYHASNGGVMASATEAWSMNSVPYLRTKLDGSKNWTDSFVLPLKKNSTLKAFLKKVDGAYGKSHSRFRWVRTFNAEKLKKALASFEDANILPSSVKVLERGKSGRVLALEIRSKGNQVSMVLKLDQIRRVLPALPSTLFVVNELQQGIWKFSGGGFGHGAGLSQAGAIDLALRGWKTSQILDHYYPGSTYGILQDLPKTP